MQDAAPQTSSPTNPVAALLGEFPVVLAPMEGVTNAYYRRLCRSFGASLCVTEFVAAEQLVKDSKLARRKAHLDADEHRTAIQIYGADPELLLAAAQIAEAANPAFVDVNCGCWIPKIARRGAGAGWLRDPAAMVAMAREIAAVVKLPLTVKTRIGWGPESHMPIIDLARRLEDVGVAALTIHCRTAAMGHNGPADWSWAARAQAVVDIPVIVNGDIWTADDAMRALAETNCAAVMIGRGAIHHPWIFRELRARLAGHTIAAPTDDERRELYRTVLGDHVATMGERDGVAATKRYIGFLGEHPNKTSVLRSTTLDDTRRALEQ